jgi:hypothetical protein
MNSRNNEVSLNYRRGLKVNGECEMLLENGARLRLSRSFRKLLQSRPEVRDVNHS